MLDGLKLCNHEEADYRLLLHAYDGPVRKYWIMLDGQFDIAKPK